MVVASLPAPKELRNRTNGLRRDFQRTGVQRELEGAWPGDELESLFSF